MSETSEVISYLETFSSNQNLKKANQLIFTGVLSQKLLIIMKPGRIHLSTTFQYFHNYTD